MKYFNHLLNDQNSSITQKDCTKLDNYLYRQIKRRKHNQLKFIGFRSKNVVIKKHKILVNRRYYFDKLNKKYLFLFDEYLQLNKWEKFTKQEKENIISFIVRKNKYREITRIFNNNIAPSTQSKMLKKYNVLQYIPNISKIQDHEKLHISVDDGYRSFIDHKKHTKYQARIVHIYQENSNKCIKNQSKFKNECVITILKNMNNKENITNKTIQIIKENLTKYYGCYDLSQIFYTCDADTQLQKIGDEISEKVILDKWHCFSRLCRAFNYKNISRHLHLNLDEKKEFKFLRKWYKSEIIKNLKLGNVEKAIELAKESKNMKYLDDTKKKAINSLIRYLKKHKNRIISWNLDGYLGSTTESQIQKNFKSFYGDVGKIHCIENFVQIARTNSIVYLI